jgi:hypothetical protein
MRFAIRLGLAFAMGVALAATTPAVFASAASIQHAQEAHVVVRNGHLAIALPLRPGRHAISEAVPLSAHSYSSQDATSSSPTIQVRVGPHNCAGYNGEIYWVFVAQEQVWFIDTYGVLWDDCYGYYNWPSTVYVYVSYNEWDEPRQNFQAFSVHDGGPAGASRGVNSGNVPTMDIFGPSDIVITACLQSLNGWQCGAGQKV